MYVRSRRAFSKADTRCLSAPVARQAPAAAPAMAVGAAVAAASAPLANGLAGEQSEVNALRTLLADATVHSRPVVPRPDLFDMVQTQTPTDTLISSALRRRLECRLDVGVSLDRCGAKAQGCADCVLAEGLRGARCSEIQGVSSEPFSGKFATLCLRPQSPGRTCVCSGGSIRTRGSTAFFPRRRRAPVSA